MRVGNTAKFNLSLGGFYPSEENKMKTIIFGLVALAAVLIVPAYAEEDDSIKKEVKTLADQTILFND